MVALAVLLTFAAVVVGTTMALADPDDSAPGHLLSRPHVTTPRQPYPLSPNLGALPASLDIYSHTLLSPTLADTARAGLDAANPPTNREQRRR